ncbi:MAG: M81 family metallopeptidase [Rhizomicrobium sp.]
MKVFTAHFCHETNVSSSIPTTLDSYRQDFLYLPSDADGADRLRAVLARRNLFSILRDRGHEVVVGLIAAAQPSRATPRKDYEFLKRELLSSLKQALPVDMVALSLHGAQVAEGVDDCESDIVRAVRAVVGKAVPIGVLLDLHGNVGPELVQSADLVVAGIEYPHTDVADRAQHLVELLERTAAKAIAPVQALAPIPMTGHCFTTREPLRTILHELVTMQGKEGLLSLSFMHGFEAANVPRGAGVIVISERDAAHARHLADRIAMRLFAVRAEIINKPLTVEDAVRRAAAGPSPAVIAEVSDNPGGGGAGDATWLLKAILDAGIGRALFGMLWDPMAVSLARLVAPGARLPFRIGGKAGLRSGPPLDVDAVVVSHHDALVQTSFAGAEDLGPAAVLRVGETDILLISKRQQVLDPSCFAAAGLHASDYRVIGIKSVHHFHAGFSTLAPTILYASQEQSGTWRSDRLKRPVWPLDATPFEVDGRRWE